VSVPFLDLTRGYHRIRDEILLAVERTLESGWYVLGREVAAFEREFADYCGTRHAVGVGSGTDALHLALRACGVKPGDGVVTAPNTAVPTVSAIVAAQACPVFVDIDPHTMTLDPAALRKRLQAGGAGPRITAVIPVHLYGGPADMDGIPEVAREHGLKVIEDAAQAHGTEYRGRRAGSLGEAGCFSFYPTKNLGACGDAGMVVTNDADVAERLRMLRNYGEEAKYRSRMDGFNSRLDELHAAMLRVKLRHLDGWLAERRRWALLYAELLADAAVTLPSEPALGRHAYHLYVVRASDRDALRHHLQRRGIGTIVHYPTPVHRQPAYEALGYGDGSFPEAERACAEVLSLPLYPELTEAEVRCIAEAVRSAS
jgi:dTDP-4-amino-4,6-dideoxygalactose transaminase